MYNSSNEYDVLIIGAGPIGLACGISCSKAGLTYLIVDKGPLVNSLYNYPLNMTFFSTSDRLEIGNVPFISHSPKPTRAEALEYYRRVSLHWKLNLALYETVDFVQTENVSFVVTSSKKQYKAKHIVIATGFYDIPNLMDVPGEDLAKVHHYYREPHIYFGQKIVVVGAANSAVDVAMETWRKGADVTMVIRDEQIRESVKYWIRPDVENRIAEGSIKAYFNSTLTEIRENQVDIQTENGIITIENDFVLAMTGYLPDFDFLSSLGVILGTDEYKTPVHDPETMQTNVKGVYLAGVICGGLKTNKWFIENSRVHADLIVQHILSNTVS
ncbi:MAG: YpdA family putative bacillithiol disulfide reductase [Chitinophagaceae bacterium]|jgi:thioredoxin reductase (NADPH)